MYNNNSPSNQTKPNVIDRDQFLQTILSYEGIPYLYGGATPEEGFDSSGFTQYVYSKIGYQLPRTSREQSEFATPIQESDLQPGDLVFYGSDENPINHVGIYIGNNEVLHSSNPKDGVKRSTYNYRTPSGFGQILNY